MGIDFLVEFPLTRESAAIKANDFVEEILLKNMNMSLVVAGTDITFGDKGKGNQKLLTQMAEKFRFQTKIINKVCIDGQEVSSSRIRNQVEAGNMEEVSKLLGRPYSISGTIVHGNHFGNTLDMPTVNIIPEQGKLLPPNGVYFSLSKIDKKLMYGVTNVGYKPTVSNVNVLGVETYLYDFNQDVYGENQQVFLLHFMRKEKKFNNINELREQLQIDKIDGKNIWKSL